MQTLFEGSLYRFGEGAHYHVARVGTPRHGFRYDLTRLDQPCRIGSFQTKGEATALRPHAGGFLRHCHGSKPEPMQKPLGRPGRALNGYGHIDSPNREKRATAQI